MKVEEKGSFLLRRYQKGVEKYIPFREREETNKEVLADLYDRLEEKYENSEVTEKDVASFLEDLGSPFEYSRLFIPNEPVIRKELTQLYRLVATIVVIVISSILLFTQVLSGFSGFISVLSWIGQTFAAALSAFGAVTLVFIAVSKGFEQIKEEAAKDNVFKVSDLPMLENEKPPSLAESIIQLVMSVLVILAFTVFIDKIGIWYRIDGEWYMGQIFLEGFNRVLPLFLIVWALQIPFAIWMIVQRGYNLAQRIVEIAFIPINLAILFILLRQGESIFNFAGLVGTPGEALGELILKVYNPLFIVLIILTIISLITKIVKVNKGK